MYGNEENSFNVFFANLGCPKNQVDGRVWINRLSKSGFNIVGNPDEADFLFVNTCAFIEDARKESTEMIELLGKVKKKYKDKKIFIVGCWAQKDGKKLFNKFSFIDGVLGNLDIDTTYKFFLENYGKNNRLIYIPTEPNKQYPIDNDLPNTYPYAYLKIAEGCDNHCSYCVIPSIRSSFRSVPVEILIEQAKFLIDNNFKEIILVAQETTRYGQDLDGNIDLSYLIEKLDSLDGDFNIRVMYLHPLRVTKKLVDTMARLPKVIKYLDIPLQHYNSKILARMNRGYDSEYIDKMLDMIHSADSDFTLRTTFIVGFPGENDDKFENLLNFVSNGYFLHQGIFEYSLEFGTEASKFPERVPSDVASLRKELLEMVQDEIVIDKNIEFENRVVEAIIDRHTIREGISIARMLDDAPEIDRQIRVQGMREPGEKVNVRIIKALTHNFLGIIEE
ncbi:30S ribosomal protein S12 methylthiotransferase RimO [bacterium]|nr:30S ribosomal protein S12 methylthiotransferase RimO [bacterium]